MEDPTDDTTTLRAPAPEVTVNQPDAFKVDPVFDPPPPRRFSASSRALWKSGATKALGPRFIKCGARVVYRLRDINDYLNHRPRKSTADPGPAA